MKTIDMVREFHEAFEVGEHKGALNKREQSYLIYLGSTLGRMAKHAHGEAEESGSVLALRFQLILEELSEVCDALGFAKGEAEILQELADLRYVCDGTALVLGLGDVLEPAVAEVHRANMSKLGADGKPIKDAAGRVVKSDRFIKADMSRVMG